MDVIKTGNGLNIPVLPKIIGTSITRKLDGLPPVTSFHIGFILLKHLQLSFYPDKHQHDCQEQDPNAQQDKSMAITGVDQPGETAQTLNNPRFDHLPGGHDLCKIPTGLIAHRSPGAIPEQRIDLSRRKPGQDQPKDQKKRTDKEENDHQSNSFRYSSNTKSLFRSYPVISFKYPASTNS